MRIKAIDHFVLTVASVEANCEFYARVLGMDVVEFSGGRKALAFGNQKINLHEAGREFEPKANSPAPGSGDFCLIAESSLAEVMAHLEREGVVIEEGPVDRTGATGPIRSVYFRDPDGNLVEVANCI
jgi:catechol 2,3-dioxygenase-like lactoylglutathione lyase family enzyme